MAFGVDTLEALTEKLKQLVNDTQNLYESFIDANELYKQHKMQDREFFARIGQYLVASSALNFLAVRVILEIKSAMDKGTSIKSPTGSAAAGPQAGFGIGGFIGGAGTAGPTPTPTSAAGQTPSQAGGSSYIMPSPQEPTFKPVDIEISRSARMQNSSPSSSSGATKSCIVCGASIPKQAKFCSKCGKSQ